MATQRDNGPLPVLLLALTVVTGLVDAFSYLNLGRVFVANMTGNVVFLGFGLAGAGGVSVLSSLLAVVAFALGAALGGRWGSGRTPHRGLLLAGATAVQAVLVLAAIVIAETAGAAGTGARLALIVLLSVSMGGQNAVVRRLAVPDLTTTVLTLTVTGLVAEHSPWRVRVRRLASVLAMLGGALLGGLLLNRVAATAPLALAAVILVGCSAWGYAAARRPVAPAWAWGVANGCATSDQKVDLVVSDGRS